MALGTNTPKITKKNWVLMGFFNGFVPILTMIILLSNPVSAATISALCGIYIAINIILTVALLCAKDVRPSPALLIGIAAGLATAFPEIEVAIGAGLVITLGLKWLVTSIYKYCTQDPDDYIQLAERKAPAGGGNNRQSSEHDHLAGLGLHHAARATAGSQPQVTFVSDNNPLSLQDLAPGKSGKHSQTDAN